MATLNLLLILVALSALALGALVLFATRAGSPRAIASVSSGLAALCALLLPFFGASSGTSLLYADSIVSVPNACIMTLLFASIVMMPAEDATRPLLGDMLVIGLGTALAYLAQNEFILLAGWIIACVPVFRWSTKGAPHMRALRWAMAGSCIALALAMVLPMFMTTANVALPAAGLFIMAIVLRQGLFPLHGPYIGACEHGPSWPLATIASAMLGAVLVVRVMLLFPAVVAEQALQGLCVVACLSALLTGVRAFAERKPRRVVALVLLSVSSSVIAGLSSGEPKGLTGGLLIWLMHMVASTGLVAVLRSLEARTDLALDPRDNLGLGSKAPRLSFFFLVFCLALVGIPGTLGFVAEDLLFHGALHSYPIIGIALPLATALNAIHLLRTWHLLFNGKLKKDVADIADALPHERLPQLLFLGFLIVLGVMPGLVMAWSTPAAEWLAQTLAQLATH
jgi:NADH-quinone oxidoreductase subunit M